MKNLINNETGEETTLPKEDLNSNLQTGQVSYKPGTKVNLVDEQGDPYTVDGSEVEDALAQGFQLESPEQQAIREYVDENKGIGGALKVAGGQLLDEAAFGLPELILNKTQDPLEVAKREALKEEHTLANTIGGVSGFVASIPLGGPLFKVGTTAGKAAASYAGKKLAATLGGKISQTAAAKLGTNIAEKAVAMGVEGAVASAPQAITEAALGDPGLAAETLLSGGILGSALGAVGGIASPLLKLGKNKATEFVTKKLDKEEAAFNLLGATPAQRNKLAPDVAEAMPDFLINITKDDPKALFSAKKLNDKISKVVRSSGKKLDDVVTRVDDEARRLAQISADDALAVKSAMYNYDELINKLDEKFIQPYKNDIRYAPQLKKVEDEIDNIRSFVDRVHKGDASPIDVRGLREYQKVTKDLVNFDKINKVTDLGTDARKLIIGDIQDYYKNQLAPKLTEVPNLASIAGEFKAANDAYRVGINLEPIIGKTLNKEAAKKMFGLYEIAGAIGGAATGGLAGGIIGGAAKKSANFAEKAFDVGGLLLTEQAMKQTAKKMDSIATKIDDLYRPTKSRAIMSFSQLTGDKEDDNFSKFSEKLVNLSNAPDALSQKLEPLTVLADTGAPKTAEMAQNKAVEAVQYLINVMPKPLTPNNILVKNKGFKPSSQELNKFRRQVEAAIDPFSIIDDLTAGSLTVEQVQTVDALYPEIMNRIREKVVDAVQSKPENVPYNKRLKLSLLLGLDLDPSLEPENLRLFMAPPQEQPQGNSPSNNATFTSEPTDVQRITNK